jgi:hypothetical protein
MPVPTRGILKIPEDKFGVTTFFYYAIPATLSFYFFSQNLRIASVASRESHYTKDSCAW